MWVQYYESVPPEVKADPKRWKFLDLHILSEYQWLKHWRDNFPNCKIRKFKQVINIE
jgi:hypothetical protein